MAIKMNFNELPKGPEPLDKGIYYIEILDVILTETKSGMDAFVFEYKVLGTENKVKDYVMINNPDGTPNNFGRKKLRTLIEAAEIDIVDITPKSLKQFSTGKVLKANLSMNDNGYPEVNYDDFYSADDAKFETLNSRDETSPQKAPSASEDIKKAVEDVKPDDFMDDEDI